LLLFVVDRLLAHIPSLKRSGEVVAQELLRFDLFDGRSNFTATNPVRQQRCLEDLAARLAATPAEVVREMEEFRALMTQPHRMRCGPPACGLGLPARGGGGLASAVWLTLRARCQVPRRV